MGKNHLFFGTNGIYLGGSAGSILKSAPRFKTIWRGRKNYSYEYHLFRGGAWQRLEVSNSSSILEQPRILEQPYTLEQLYILEQLCMLEQLCALEQLCRLKQQCKYVLRVGSLRPPKRIMIRRAWAKRGLSKRGSAEAGSVLGERSGPPPRTNMQSYSRSPQLFKIDEMFLTMALFLPPLGYKLPSGRSESTWHRH